MTLRLLRHIGVADMELVKLHKMGVMEFMPSESCCHSNYRYLQQRLYRLLSKNFSVQSFFPKDWVSLMFAESVEHRGEHFWNLGLQIAGKCISDTFFDFKPHNVHHLLINTIPPLWILWFGVKVHKILSPKSVHKSW